MANKKTIKEPKTIRDLTKEYMLNYIEKNYDDNDIDFLIDLADNNINTKEVKKENNKSTVVERYDWSVIRRKFAEKFRPDLLPKGKNKLTFSEELKRIKEKKNKKTSK